MCAQLIPDSTQRGSLFAWAVANVRDECLFMCVSCPSISSLSRKETGRKHPTEVEQYVELIAFSTAGRPWAIHAVVQVTTCCAIYLGGGEFWEEMKLSKRHK